MFIKLTSQYISVYPVALSVRSTNVYEERSLGLFDDEEEEEFQTDEKGAQAVAKYLGWQWVPSAKGCSNTDATALVVSWLLISGGWVLPCG